MPQEELHRFPQCSFAELGYSLRVLLDGYMQGVSRSENPSCGNQAFQFGRGHRLDRFRIIRQPIEDLISYPLRLRFVGKVFLYASSRRIKCELVHGLAAIDRLIEFDRLLSVRNNCRHISMAR
jgi:hypothetical protein